MLKPLLHILSVFYCLFSIAYCPAVSAQATPDSTAAAPAPVTADDVEKFFADTIPIASPPAPAATTADTLPKVSADTSNKAAALPPTPVTTDSVEKFFADTVAAAKTPLPPKGGKLGDTTAKIPPSGGGGAPHLPFIMEFVKEKVEHHPDSTFFNILKITNNNAKPVQGVVKISAPIDWKIISDVETVVNVSPGSTEYVPIRVSLPRTATGGTSYLINATLYSNRRIFPDKNQTSISKACYVTIPKKTKWDIIPLQRIVYFNRYIEYAPLQLRMTNKGNGSETVKLEFDIGSSLQMYGAFANKYFTSVELKPHQDTVLIFRIKYMPPDESGLWSRDFSKLTVRITAEADTLIKKSSVNFKHLESAYYNMLYSAVSPLNIEVHLQNLLSEVAPRLMFDAHGNIYFKNEHTFDYYLRTAGIAFTGYTDNKKLLEQTLWQRSQMRAKYDAGRWTAMAGDMISSPALSMLGSGGRGIGGSYRINAQHNVHAALTANLAAPIYSGGLQHETTLLKKIALASGLSFILDDYNKVNTLGAGAQASYAFLQGHNIHLLLMATQTQHLYNNQTFFDLSGNPIITTDPNTTFYGFGAQVQYNMQLKKLNANLNALASSKHFSQFYNGQMLLNGTGRYTMNKKYFLAGGLNLTAQDPRLYNRGILYPENNYFAGRYYLDFGDKLTSKLLFYGGPILEHLRHRRLKVTPTDSTYTRFSSVSPKLSLRLNFKNNINGSINPYAVFGRTYITSAVDSTIGPPSPDSKTVFFNAVAGVNLLQKNFGLNIFYYYGPHSISGQTDYYYFNSYSKSLRVIPYFQKYYFNKKVLLSSYNSYYYEAISSAERITLNARVSFFLDKGWTLFVDNNLYSFSRIGADGVKFYSKNYYLNLGFKKIFDIPQPGIKYYDLKVICFKDINGNGIPDNDEHGISDIVLTVDRFAGRPSDQANAPLSTEGGDMGDTTARIPPSVRKDSFGGGGGAKHRGQFAPAEMVTDNFGQVIYYHIPEGEFSLNVFPLVNLIDLYNVNGQKQTVTVSKDTTYYIPFALTYRVNGNVILNRDEYSSLGAVSAANIRITATDSLGNSFPALTISDGSYILYVPQAGKYTVSINNVFGEQFLIQESEYTISFDGAKEFHVDFIFDEKKRQINIASTDTAAIVRDGDTIKVGPKNVFIYSEKTVFDIDTINTIRTDTIHTVSMDTIRNLTVITDTVYSQTTPGKWEQYYYSLPVAPGVSYRVQIFASAKRLTPSQRGAKFKGIPNVAEYTEAGTYKYTVGDLSSIDEAKKLKADLRSKGYKDAFLVPFYGGKRVREK